MARRENAEAQPSSAQRRTSKPKDKKPAKSSATLDKYLHDSPSVQDRIIYQPVDKQYWREKKASDKAELERLERLANGR